MVESNHCQQDIVRFEDKEILTIKIFIMDDKNTVIEAIRKAGEPVNATKVAELTGLDKKVVDKVFAQLKKTAPSPRLSAANTSSPETRRQDSIIATGKDC